jgi:hypothetical protein
VAANECPSLQGNQDDEHEAEAQAAFELGLLIDLD